VLEKEAGSMVQCDVAHRIRISRRREAFGFLNATLAFLKLVKPTKRAGLNEAAADGKLSGSKR
jgi:hypothetical protein